MSALKHVSQQLAMIALRPGERRERRPLIGPEPRGPAVGFDRQTFWQAARTIESPA